MTGLSAAPVVAHVVRSGFVESVHRGIAVVTAGGALVDAVGDPATVVLPRSSHKPLQAVGMLHCGGVLSAEELAVACASHNGEPRHTAAVRRTLARAGLTEADLLNSPDLPLEPSSRSDWLRAGRGREAVAHGCSGKHAAMLATCVSRGWDLAGYLDPAHPLQVALAATLADLTGEHLAWVAVDGCGAPAHAYPLAGLARAFGRLAGATAGPERAVADAMRAHPGLVAGRGRSVTRLMMDVPGLLAKDGAEGVYAVGLDDGRGFAVKGADGADRAAAVAMAALLRRNGAAPADALARLADAPVLGHGRPVGAVVAAS